MIICQLVVEITGKCGIGHTCFVFLFDLTEDGIKEQIADLDIGCIRVLSTNIRQA